MTPVGVDFHVNGDAFARAALLLLSAARRALVALADLDGAIFPHDIRRGQHRHVHVTAL